MNVSDAHLITLTKIQATMAASISGQQTIYKVQCHRVRRHIRKEKKNKTNTRKEARNIYIEQRSFNRTPKLHAPSPLPSLESSFIHKTTQNP